MRGDRRLIGCLIVTLLTARGVPAALAATGDARSPEARDATMEHALRDAAMLQTLQSREHLQPQPAVVSPASAPASAGAVDPTRFRIAVNGSLTDAAVPRLFAEGQPMFALKPVAQQLFFSVVDLGRGRYQVVSPEGRRRDVTAVIIGGVSTLTEAELERVFDAEATLDTARGVLSLQRAGAGAGFRTYVTEKPPEQVVEEEAVKAKVEQFQHPVENEEIPQEAWPSVDVWWQEAYTYRQSHAAPMFRSLISSLRGRLYDYDLNFVDARKDRSGIFRHDYTSLVLQKPDFSLHLFDQSTNLSPLRFQSDAFNGVSVVKTFGPLRGGRGQNVLTTSYGDTENFAPSRTGASVKYLGGLAQVRDDFQALDWLKLQGAMLYVENEPDLPEQGGTTAIPRTNTVLFSGAELDLPHHLRWQNHAAFSMAQPDDKPDVRRGDRDIRSALRYETDRTLSDLAYEFVGGHYASFGDPTSYQDYNGLTWFGSTRLTDWWRLSGSLLRYNNNVERHPTAVTTKTENASIGSAFQITERQSLNLTASQFLTKPHGGRNAGTSTRSSVYRADYFWPFLFDSRLLTSYQYFTSAVREGDNSLSHNAGVSLFKSYGRGSNLYASENLTWSFADAAADSFDLTTSVNWDHHWNDRLSTYVNTAYSRNETDDAQTTNSFSAATGLRTQLLEHTQGNVEYSLNGYDPKTERHRWPKSWSLLFFISQAVNIKSPPNFGKIEGRLFEDLNANGVYDAGEPGIPDAMLTIDDARQVSTDSAGRFVATKIVPGRRHLKLDTASLDPRYAIRSPTRSVEVFKRRTLKLEFPLVRAGTIRGHVFIDANHDHAFQDTEEPLEGVAIILLPGDQSRRTDADGSFAFEGVYPGEQTLLIHHGDIPVGYHLTSPDARTISVKAGEEVRVDFSTELLR